MQDRIDLSRDIHFCDVQNCLQFERKLKITAEVIIKQYTTTRMVKIGGD